MIKGLLLDFYGTVVEDDDAIMDEITREFLAGVTLPICIVSDVDRADLVAALAFHGLTFTAVVTSEDARAYKPDRAMFSRALAALGLAAGEVLHVGDSLNADVAGAHAAGIRAIWVNRRGQAVPDGAPVPPDITDLAGLPAFLQ